MHDSSSPLKKYQVPSVESACRILRAIGDHGDCLSMSQLCAVSGTSRTSTLRIVSSLCQHGFLRREEDGKLATGDVFQVLGSRLHGASDLRQRAVPVLGKLVQATGETAHLALPLETHCFLQEVVDSPQLVRVASRPGTLIDYHCSATGKCLLAFGHERLLTLRQSMELSARTRRTITIWDDLDACLRQVRKQGYALDDEEYHEGVRCLGVPVRDASGRVIAAIGVTGTCQSFEKDRIPTVAQQVIQAAAELSR
ncbi:MAG: IclR family transcriptional regulator [Opitutales bacterium]